MSSKKDKPKKGGEEEESTTVSSLTTAPETTTTSGPPSTTTPGSATVASASMTATPPPGISARQRLLEEKATYSAAAGTRRESLRARSLISPTLDWVRVEEMAMAAQYDTYDPVVMQIRVLEKTGRSLSTLTKLLLANVFFGNNADRRSKNVVDKDKVKPIMDTLAATGVVKGKPSSEGLTLARVGNSHPVLLLLLRRRLASRGIIQTSGVTTDCPVEMADLSLAPVSGLFPEIGRFITAFAKVLFLDAKRREKIPKDMTEDAWMQNQEKFRTLAVTAFGNDPHFKGFTTAHINALTYEQAGALMGYGA
jgi:hypothetical protein